MRTKDYNTAYDPNVHPLRAISGCGAYVWQRYAILLSDNRRKGDECCRLMIAPAMGADVEYLYVETNGDPVVVGRVDRDGHGSIVTFAEGYRPECWAVDGAENWIAEGLAEAGL